MIADLSGNMEHEYIFFGGRRMARKDLPENIVSYYFSDHLHSASVITDSAGNIKAESDYRPFAAELQIVNALRNELRGPARPISEPGKDRVAKGHRAVNSG